MTLPKVEGLVIEHAIALTKLEERSDNLKKEVSDLNLSLAAGSIIAKELEAAQGGLSIRVALIENEAAGSVTAKELEATLAGLTTRVAFDRK